MEMEKAKQKKPNKVQPQTGKSSTTKQPLKVVYITNPIKNIKTSASEFRSLVQELTGKDSDVSESSKFATADGGSGKNIKGKEEANINIYDHVPISRNIGQSSTIINGHDLPPAGSESDPSSLIDEMYTINEDFMGGSYFDDHFF